MLTMSLHIWGMWHYTTFQVGNTSFFCRCQMTLISSWFTTRCGLSSSSEFISRRCTKSVKWSSACWMFVDHCVMTMQLTRGVGILEHVCVDKCGHLNETWYWVNDLLTATSVTVTGSNCCEFTGLQSQWTTAAYWCRWRTYTSLWSVSRLYVITAVCASALHVRSKALYFARFLYFLSLEFIDWERAEGCPLFSYRRWGPGTPP